MRRLQLISVFAGQVPDECSISAQEMVMVGLIAVLLVASASAAPPVQPNLADQLVGSWRLVTYEARRPSGEVSAIFGPSPVGRLMYDADGRMSVHIMDPRRRKFASGDRLIHTSEELTEAFDGYFGYFGTYTVEEAAGTVTHHITGAAFPNLVGTEQRRFFVLSGNRLELKTPPMPRGGTQVTLHLVWEREPANNQMQRTRPAQAMEPRR